MSVSKYNPARLTVGPNFGRTAPARSFRLLLNAGFTISNIGHGSVGAGDSPAVHTGHHWSGAGAQTRAATEKTVSRSGLSDSAGQGIRTRLPQGAARKLLPPCTTAISADGGVDPMLNTPSPIANRLSILPLLREPNRATRTSRNAANARLPFAALTPSTTTGASFVPARSAGDRDGMSGPCVCTSGEPAARPAAKPAPTSASCRRQIPAEFRANTATAIAPSAPHMRRRWLRCAKPGSTCATTAKRSPCQEAVCEHNGSIMPFSIARFPPQARPIAMH